MLRTRVNEPGFYLLDEPDAPLSFIACLGLVALLHDLAQAGAQAVVATHSPMIAAVPGASILELGAWGIRAARWEEPGHCRALAPVPARAGLLFPALAGWLRRR